MADRAEFNKQWPDLAERLRRYLARRRIPQALWDDVVQETGLRMFLYWERVDPRASLWGLTRKIAGIVLWDSYNRAVDSPEVSDLPDRAAPDDVEQAVLARVELRRIEAALAQLTPAQRAALLAEIGGPAPEGLSGAAVKMLRMRARRRLDTILGRSQGVAFPWRGRIRELWRRATTPRGRTSSLSESLAMGAASTLVVMSLMLAPPNEDPFVAPEGSAPADAPNLPHHENELLADVVLEDVDATRRLVRERLQKSARRAARRTSRLIVAGIEPIALARAGYQDSTRIAREHIHTLLPEIQGRVEETPLGGVREVKTVNRAVRKVVYTAAGVTGPPPEKKKKKRG